MAVTGTEIGSVSILKGNKVNLPVLADGVMAIAEDEKKLYIGTATGNQGIVSSAPAAQTWIAPTLLNAWVNTSGSPPAGYYKDDLGIVRLRGLIKSGTTTAGTLLFTLPAGYRPSFSILLNTLTYNGTAITALDLFFNTNGNVNIDAIAASSNWLNLDGLTFRAEG